MILKSIYLRIQWKRKFGFLSVFVHLFCSCSGGNGVVSFDDCAVIAERTVSADGDTVVVCDISSVRDTFDLPLSALFSDFRIINLEEGEDALVTAEGRIVVSDRYVGIFSPFTGYKLFDGTGRYLGAISSRGQGSDEYAASIYDSFIDEANNRIYLLPMQMSRKILVFDLRGNAQRHIPLAYPVSKGRFRVDAANGRLLVMVMPFPGTPSVVWTQDFEGNVIQEVASGHYTTTVRPDYSNEIFASQSVSEMDFSLFHWVAQEDTLYHYDEQVNRLKPTFTAMFKGEEIQHDYMELAEYYAVRLFMNQVFTNAPAIMVDKRTLRGSYVRFNLDILGGIPGSPWLEISRGYYIANMYAYELKEQLEAALDAGNLTPDMRTKIKQLNGSLGVDDNNVILVGKLKNTTEPPSAAPAYSSVAEANQNNDNRVYGFMDMKDHIKDTPILANVQEYFRKNNKYAHWNMNDKKEVSVKAIAEKDGTTSNVEIGESCGIVELDNEALRLIREAVLQPGTNKKGQPIRCDYVIHVYFPPQ